MYINHLRYQVIGPVLKMLMLDRNWQCSSGTYSWQKNQMGLKFWIYQSSVRLYFYWCSRSLCLIDYLTGILDLHFNAGFERLSWHGYQSPVVIEGESDRISPHILLLAAGIELMRASDFTTATPNNIIKRVVFGLNVYAHLAKQRMYSETSAHTLQPIVLTCVLFILLNSLTQTAAYCWGDKPRHVDIM